MVEMKQVQPGHVAVLQEGRETGRARWTLQTLAWGREQVKVACVDTLDCPAELTADVWDYLGYLWQKEAVAAVCRDGRLTWFSQALERSWRAAGSPPLA